MTARLPQNLVLAGCGDARRIVAQSIRAEINSQFNATGLPGGYLRSLLYTSA